MAAKIKNLIKPTSKVEPMIYAYTTPGVTYHDGYIKIGYTEQNVDVRIYQQTHTAGIKANKEWEGRAVYDDDSGDTFRDTDFHVYLRRLGIRQPQDEKNEYFDERDRNEWFHIGAEESEEHFHSFRLNRGILPDDLNTVASYRLRAEQEKAVVQTKGYLEKHKGGEFLWNAKPRFGKTLSVYDFIMRVGAKRVLVVTNRPAIANSWYKDYERFVGRSNGYFFVSNVEEIKDKRLTISYDEYVITEKGRRNRFPDAQPMGLIEFVSLQDLKGSTYFGGSYNKLREVADVEWDVLVIDEAHEGVDTYKTDVAFNHIRRKFTLHLSGTPFKALAREKFPDDAIYSWTYADEQRAKTEWGETEENPYVDLPRLNLFTYQMSQIIMDKIAQGIEIDGETEEYAFDLNEFFAVDRGRFVHEESVDRFLDALTTQEKYPFSSADLRDKLKHTFWLLNRVESARLLARKLEKHTVFKDYKIILAAGDGKLDDDIETKKSYAQVVKAIREHDKTITLSVGQLTTGVTIPEWTAVLMLSNVKSPALYMQAAFRAQNPCVYAQKTADEKLEIQRKENAYVFDFDPARTLIIFEQIANDLYRDTAEGRGDLELRKRHIRELLNFFPVIGEDNEGSMVELDAEQVLSIPRRIKCSEVVQRGFMSDFLFQNISHVFHAPQKVVEIINRFTPVSAPSRGREINTDDIIEVPVNGAGDVEVGNETVIGLTHDVFGDKIFRDVEEGLGNGIPYTTAGNEEKESDEIDTFKQKLHRNVIEPVLRKAKEHYGDEMKSSDEKQLMGNLTSDMNQNVDRMFAEHKIQQRTIEQEHKDELQQAKECGATHEQIEELDRKYAQKQGEERQRLNNELTDFSSDLAKTTAETVVQTMETNVRTRQKQSIEGDIRDHLRGFSRTIPSFLMAYGSTDLTLENFDRKIPDDVFREVTGISENDFRFLRDGGEYPDPETGEQKHFEGHLFDETVFNDSVQEFLKKKKELSNYFDESHAEDIFDYIPPQKTNQIFTPRRVVKQMVDALEEENPGCFDNPEHTFADLYMKSGMYIAEIVKRLFRSKKMKKLYPDDKKRIKHILQKQVYGMAPTRIIFLIATNYILGFDEEVKNETKNFVQADAAAAAKEGTLEQLVEKYFG